MVARECKKFLKSFDFKKLEWDGVELTAFGENNEPFGQYGFLPNSPTRRAFEALEDIFRKCNIKSYQLAP